MSLNVTKLKQIRRFQNIVEEIEAAIVQGNLQPGDQLPPELELKEMFGTGRGTVREALRVLEEKGLITIRAGASGGAFVQQADPAKLTQHLDLLVQAGGISPDHIREFRETVEPLAASLAARRAEIDGIDRLHDIFAQAEQKLLDGDTRGFLKGDVAVHVAMAELTGNPLLVAVLRMVHEQVLDASDKYDIHETETLVDNLNDLHTLVRAVADGNPDEAAHRALAHIRKFHPCMQAAKT